MIEIGPYWQSFLEALTLSAFWILAAASLVVCYFLASMLTRYHLRRDADPITSARSMTILAAVTVYIAFGGVAYAFDVLTPGVILAGAAILLLLPIAAALVLGRALDDEPI